MLHSSDRRRTDVTIHIIHTHMYILYSLIIIDRYAISSGSRYKAARCYIYWHIIYIIFYRCCTYVLYICTHIYILSTTIRDRDFDTNSKHTIACIYGVYSSAMSEWWALTRMKIITEKNKRSRYILLIILYVL